MENAPTIILFWYLITASVIGMCALLITAMALVKKGKAIAGKVCFGLGIGCGIPIIAVLGYMVYLHIG